MDRLGRTVAICGLVVMAGSGCRATRDEVPPGRPYRADGRQEAPVGFGSAPHTSAMAGAGNAANGMPGVGGPTTNAFGRAGGGDLTGTVPGRTFGPPTTAGAIDASMGSSGLGTPPPLTGAPGPGSPTSRGPAMSVSPGGPPPTEGDGSFLAPPQARGVMGTRDQIPSPN